MSVSNNGWSNKRGTSDRLCKCGSWANHWVKFNSAKQSWPKQCAVEGCSSQPDVGGHVIHPDAKGERIVPLCNSCNGLSSKFNLKPGTQIPSANVTNTCG